jgi:hypothetical protein
MLLSAFALGFFWLVLGIILLNQLLLVRCDNSISRLARRSCYQPLRYWRSFIGLYLFTYSTMANTFVGFLFCINVGDGTLYGQSEKRVFVSPTLSCDNNDYKGWYPIVMALLIILVLLPPAISVIWLTRNREQFGSPLFTGRFGNLYEPYQPTAFWSVSSVSDFTFTECSFLNQLH